MGEDWRTRFSGDKAFGFLVVQSDVKPTGDFFAGDPNCGRQLGVWGAEEEAEDENGAGENEGLMIPELARPAGENRERGLDAPTFFLGCGVPKGLNELCASADGVPPDVIWFRSVDSYV